MRYRVVCSGLPFVKETYWVEDSGNGGRSARAVFGSNTRSKKKAERLCARLNGVGKAKVIERRKERRARRRKSPVREVAYPKTDWKENRKVAKRAMCECCEQLYLSGPHVFPQSAILKEHLHHLIPARLAKLHGNPHDPVNILSVCEREHGGLKVVDNLILKGDFVGAVAAANRLHVPMDRFRAAAEHYGFKIGGILT